MKKMGIKNNCDKVWSFKSIIFSREMDQLNMLFCLQQKSQSQKETGSLNHEM